MLRITAYHSAKLIAATLVLSAASLPITASAQQDSGDKVKSETYDMLAAQSEDRMGDPEYDYALGVAAADAGRYGEAILAFQRVLAVQPENAPARAELARVYALAGDIDTARDQFDTVVDDPTLPDPVRQRFTGLVRQLDKQIAGGGNDVSGFAEAAAGYDSNINSATELTSITIPLFAGLGPGTLGANARSIDDEFYELRGGLSGVSAVSRQDRVFGSVLATWRDNIDNRRFDQASVTGTAGFAHSFANRDVISLSAQVQQFWLGHDSFRQAYGVIGQYTHLLEQGKALSVSAQYNRFDYDGDPLRDADRFSLGLAYVTKNVSLNMIGGHEETRRQPGDANSNSFGTASISGELPVSERVALIGGAAFDLRRYDQTDILFLRKRKDERIDVNAGLKFALTDTIILQGRGSYARNFSNIGLYDYDRWTVSAGLRFEF